MTIPQVSRLFKQLLIGLVVYDVVLFLYVLISGRVIGEMYGGEIFIGLTFFVIVIAMLSMLTSLIYAISKKEYPMLWKSAGFLGVSFIAYILALIMTLATVF